MSGIQLIHKGTNVSQEHSYNSMSQTSSIASVSQQAVAIRTAACRSICINNNHYLLYNVPGDGDCYFHCFSYLRYGDLSMTGYFRYIICSEVFDHWFNLKDDIELGHNFSPNTPDTYRDNMLLGNAWASSVEVTASSHVLNCNVNIFVSPPNPGQSLQCYEDSYNVQNPSFSISILLSSNHYQLLIPFDINSAEGNRYLQCQTLMVPYIYPPLDETASEKHRRTNTLYRRLSRVKKSNARNVSAISDASNGPKNSSTHTTISGTCNQPQNSSRHTAISGSCNGAKNSNAHTTISGTSTCNAEDDRHSNKRSRTGIVGTDSSSKRSKSSSNVPIVQPSQVADQSFLNNADVHIYQTSQGSDQLLLNNDDVSIDNPSQVADQSLLNNAVECIKKFEETQMSYEIKQCSICLERRINMKMKMGSDCCARCARDKNSIKMFSTENNMNPGVVPPELKDLSVIEQNLICRIAPCMNIHMLKHGGIAANGHCVTFPQEINEPCKVLPNLPESINMVRFRKKGRNDSSKDFRVRRHVVQNALHWLRNNNPAYSDIEISLDRLNGLPEDGEISMGTVEFGDNVERQNDMGPAPDQTVVPDGNQTTISSVLLPDPVCNIAEKVDNLLTEVSGPDHPLCTTNRRGDIVVPWPSRQDVPISEFTTINFFTLAFPGLFPYGHGDFYSLRPRTCQSMADWAGHLLWFSDGRFSRHAFFKFVVHNMILRKQTLEQSKFIISQKIGDPHLTIENLRRMLQDGRDDIAKTILYFSSKIRGTNQYWSQRSHELRALIQFKIDSGDGLPSFFATASCAEFHFKPLRRLLSNYIQLTTGQNVDLSDKNVLFTALQENSHLVGHYFDLRTTCYIKEVMKPIFGIDTYWLRYEFAKSRGMIHWHGLSWRSDKQPHKLLFDGFMSGLPEEEIAEILSSWAKSNLGMSACHPAGRDDVGNPRKDLWPPPEGTAPAPPEDSNPLVKLLSDVACDQDSLLEDYLLLSNRVNIHRCSDYCLREPRRGSRKDKECRMEFGSEANPGKQIRDQPALVKDRNGCKRLEMERDHPCLVQNSRFHTQGWRANGDISLLLSKTDPANPSVDDIIAIERYVCGYACKGNEGTGALVDVFRDMTHASGDATTKSLCTKFLMSTVKRDVSAVEASFELSSLPLYRCSHQFVTVSLSGFRQLELKGHSLTKNTPLDKYLARDAADNVSFYKFIRRSNKVPLLIGANVRATCPLTEDYCRSMLLLHWPHWLQISDVKDVDKSWTDLFSEFITSDSCPNLVKADVERSKRNIAPDPLEDNLSDSDNGDDNENQPAWMDTVQPHALFDDYTDNFDYDDGGPLQDWSLAGQDYPSDFGVTWLQTTLDFVLPESENLSIPDVALESLNSEQQFVFNLVMQTLMEYKNNNSFQPLRLIVSGAAGSGKSFLIKCLVKAVRLLFNKNEAVQVVCPTGSSANLIDGVTLHSFFKIPNSKVKEMVPPDGARGLALQKNCNELKALFVDERSLIGCRTLGWMEFLCKCGMKARCGDESSTWGGLPVVVFLGDDVQLPPVADTPVYMSTSTSIVGVHGYLIWKTFDNAVVLKSVVRQGENQPKLRDALSSLRNYDLSSNQSKWLQQFHYHCLKSRFGTQLIDRLNQFGLFVFPTHAQEWEHNKQKLLDCNKFEPVAKLVAVNSGPHSKEIPSDKACGLLPIIYICKSAKVMLTTNIAVRYGLFNGAPGTIVDIIYKGGRRPPDFLPDVIMVQFDTYTGPSFVSANHKIVPIVPVERRLDCYCYGCRRKQVPLRLGWGTTIHRCQGMTIGHGEPNRYIVIDPGPKHFEGRNPGALFVALSRAKNAGECGEDPDFAWHPKTLVNEDRLCFKANTKTTRLRAEEIKRILKIEHNTQINFSQLLPHDVFQQNLLFLAGIQQSVSNEL